MPETEGFFMYTERVLSFVSSYATNSESSADTGFEESEVGAASLSLEGSICIRSGVRIWSHANDEEKSRLVLYFAYVLRISSV